MSIRPFCIKFKDFVCGKKYADERHYHVVETLARYIKDKYPQINDFQTKIELRSRPIKPYITKDHIEASYSTAQYTALALFTYHPQPDVLLLYDFIIYDNVSSRGEKNGS
jgi:hypothetical protein